MAKGAEKVTVETLQEMKRNRQRIAAMVCYDDQMAQILDRAGADVLSVGDSVGRTFLGQTAEEHTTVDMMIMFCRAVVRGAKRALVNCDMPTSIVNDPNVTAEAARRIAGEAGPSTVKVDIREDMEKFFPSVEAAAKTGVIGLYPQIGFSHLVRESGQDKLDYICKKAQALEAIGAKMTDLTGVSPEIYAAASAAVRIPVIGGQSGPEADGRIYVSAPLVGYNAAMLDQDAGTGNAARYVFEIAREAIANVHAGTFNSA
jgi:3-methyl-2-oxobutanoate hydroxymethyltransferase